MPLNSYLPTYRMNDELPSSSEAAPMSTAAPGVTAEEWRRIRQHVDNDALDAMVGTLAKLRTFFGCPTGRAECEYSEALNRLRLLAAKVGEAPDDALAWHLFALSRILTAKSMALIGSLETIQVGLGKLRSGFPDRFEIQEFDEDYELDLTNDSTTSRLSRFTRGDFSGADYDDTERKNSHLESDT